MDFITFGISFTFFFIFNIIYWSYASQNQMRTRQQHHEMIVKKRSYSHTRVAFDLYKSLTILLLISLVNVIVWQCSFSYHTYLVSMPTLFVDSIQSKLSQLIKEASFCQSCIVRRLRIFPSSSSCYSYMKDNLRPKVCFDQKECNNQSQHTSQPNRRSLSPKKGFLILVHTMLTVLSKLLLQLSNRI